MDMPNIKTVEQLFEYLQKIDDDQLEKFIAHIHKQGLIQSPDDFRLGVKFLRNQIV